MLKRRCISSPLGELTLAAEDGALVSLSFQKTPFFASEPVLLAAERQLNEYFDGRRKIFELPLCVDGSPFSRAVLTALWEQVPYGQTLTYGELAALAGFPRAARAVGNALNRNPLPILVPCHRVVGVAHAGNYAWGMDKKRFLMKLEGSL